MAAKASSESKRGASTTVPPANNTAEVQPMGAA
jgi:hypothetical protein